MSKAGLTDMDNLLQLQKEDGSPEDVMITPDPSIKEMVDIIQNNNDNINMNETTDVQ